MVSNFNGNGHSRFYRQVPFASRGGTFLSVWIHWLRLRAYLRGDIPIILFKSRRRSQHSPDCCSASTPESSRARFWTFLLYAALSLVGLWLCFRFVPETEGVPLERIERDFRLGGRCGIWEPRDSTKKINSRNRT